MEHNVDKGKDFSRSTMSIFLSYFKPHMGLFVLRHSFMSC